ncbi:MAG: EcsC family protein [Candidatus Cloacimonetes bacterium]|nr:EcsC family protein [Candidatus Cloacimonadota bacterium]
MYPQDHNNEELGRIEKALLEVANNVGISETKTFNKYSNVCGLEAQSIEEVWLQDLECARKISEDWKKWAKIQAGSSGVGFGMTGLVGLIPDITVLMAINLRMIQAIALTYGFSFTSEQEKIELWFVIGSCLGVSQYRDIVGKSASKSWDKYIQGTPCNDRPLSLVLRKIAKALSIKLTKKSVVKTVPLLASPVGGAMNYSMTESVGVKAIDYFEEKKKYCIHKKFNPFQSSI